MKILGTASLGSSFTGSLKKNVLYEAARLEMCLHLI